MAVVNQEKEKQLVVVDDKVGTAGAVVPAKGPPTAIRNASGGSVPRPGFFTIYKKGQGKWTRLGTVFAAAGLGIGTAFATYGYLQPYTRRNADLLICIGLLAIYSVAVYWLMNRAQNAEFLIATDSEMKKVNWTTQGELFGSTRVVVLFLVIVALFLFGVDVIFAELFHLIHVLRTSPFQ